MRCIEVGPGLRRDNGGGRSAKAAFALGLLACLSLAACATDRLALAPAAPDRPWQIPKSFDLPVPGSHPAGEARLATQDDEPEIILPRGNAVPVERDRRYDLASLIDLAQRNNPETREAWERARQAALAVGLAETSYVPQIAAEIVGGFQHTPLPIPSNLIAKGWFTSDTREVVPMLTAKWLLFDFGQRDGAVDAAKATAFVAEQALKSAQIVEDAVTAKRAHELATVVELAQAKRQTAQARFNLEHAKGADSAAYSALVAALGVAPDTPISIADSSDKPLPAAPAGDVDQLVRDALASRPDIVAAFGKLHAAEASLRGAEATYYPTIGLEAQAYQNFGGLSSDGSRYFTVNEPGASVLVKVSLPLFDGGARDARISAAHSQVAEAKHALDHSQDEATQQVTDAYDSLHTGFAEFEASRAVVQAAETAYDAALDAYRHGVSTYTDLANTETALSQARSAKEDAHATVFTAAAALAFSTGAIRSEP